MGILGSKSIFILGGKKPVGPPKVLPSLTQAPFGVGGRRLIGHSEARMEDFVRGLDGRATDCIGRCARACAVDGL